MQVGSRKVTEYTGTVPRPFVGGDAKFSVLTALVTESEVVEIVAIGTKVLGGVIGVGRAREPEIDTRPSFCVNIVEGGSLCDELGFALRHFVVSQPFCVDLGFGVLLVVSVRWACFLVLSQCCDLLWSLSALLLHAWWLDHNVSDSDLGNWRRCCQRRISGALHLRSGGSCLLITSTALSRQCASVCSPRMPSLEAFSCRIWSCIP